MIIYCTFPKEKYEKLILLLIELRNLFTNLEVEMVKSTEFFAFIEESDCIKIIKTVGGVNKIKNNKKKDLINVIANYLSSGYKFSTLCTIKVLNFRVIIALGFKYEVGESEVEELKSKDAFENSFLGIIFKNICSYMGSKLNGEQNIVHIEEVVSRSASEYITKLTLLDDISIIREISSSTYEGAYCYGKIAFSSMEILPTKLKLTFKKSIPLIKKEIRQIRKLLEIATDNNCLFLQRGDNDSYYIKGIADKNKLGDAYIIEFNGYEKWNLIKSDQILLSFAKNNYARDIKHAQINTVKIREAFTLNQDDIAKLQNIIINARKQKHGTMLIITPKAKEEVQRLASFKRGLEIEPIDLSINLDMIACLTAIDGAVFLNPNGMCYGIGVIVDGVANIEGQPSRGARFNSANTYIYNLEGDAAGVACVLSEDGTLDLLYSSKLVADGGTKSGYYDGISEMLVGLLDHTEEN